MSETLNTPNSSDSAEASPDIWEEVANFQQEQTAIVEKSTGNPPTQIDSQEKEEAVTLAREEVMRSFIAQEQPEIQESQKEMASFMGIDIPKEFLGEELVTVEEVQPQKRGGLFRKIKEKKDSELLEEMMYDNLGENEEVLKKEFNGRMVALFMKEFEECRYANANKPRLIEALPLEKQEEIFENRTYDTTKQYISQYTPDDEYGFTPSYLMKVLTGTTKVMENQSNFDHFDHSDIQSICSLAEKMAESTKNGENDEVPDQEVFKMMSEFIQKREQSYPEEIQQKLGKLKLHLAVELLPKEYFFEHFDEIVDEKYTSSDQVSLWDLSKIIEKYGIDNEEEQTKLRVFPPHILEFSLSHKEQIEAGKYFSDTVNEKQMEKITEKVESFDGIISDKELLFEVYISEEKQSEKVLELLTNSSNVDETVLKNILRYIGYRNSTPCPINMPVENLEDIRDYDSFFKRCLKKGLEEYTLVSEYAKEMMSQFLYGADATTISRDLISLGVIEVSSLNRKEDTPVEKMSRFKVHINRSKLEELQSSEEVTDAQKSLILDAIDFVCSKDDDLADRFERVADKRRVDDTELGDILGQMREKRMHEVSTNYSAYMTELLQQNAQVVNEVSFEGKTIPVMEIVGNDFMMLVHHLGAYNTKENDKPQNWNEKMIYGSTDSEGDPVGYISTCAIASGCMRMAASPEQIESPDEVFYGFTDFGEDSLLFTSEYDLCTEDVIDLEGNVKTSTNRQDFIDPDPRAIIERTKRATLTTPGSFHNEVVLDRYSGNPEEHGGRLQPNYLITFSDDQSKISDTVKKHAAYFGIPILMINYDKYK